MKYGCQSMVAPVDAILLKRAEDAFISQQHLNQNYERFGFFGAPDYEICLREYKAFEDIICANVPQVFFLPQDEEVGLDSIYTHDPLKITKRGAIYFPMGKALRQPEGAATQRYLEKLGIPTLGHIQPPGKMEGGDVLWIDENTVAIGQGYRTNAEGIRQFQELTRDFVHEYIIVPMPHGEGENACLHLMSVISFVDRDKAVVYSKYMPVFFRQWLLARGITLLECSDEEYELLGSNLLALCPGKVLLIEGCPNIQGKLEAAGIQVITYAGKEMSLRGTGGPTCLSCPLARVGSYE